MKATLEKYIAPENIPRKYGGTLDFKFGMLPILEPAIVDTLDWTIPEVAPTTAVAAANGNKVAPKETSAARSFPIGPIKWQATAQNSIEELDAITVGSIEGKSRREVVARLKTEWGFLHGIRKENTPVDWAMEKVVSTSGVDTQPPEGDPEYGMELADMTEALTEVELDGEKGREVGAEGMNAAEVKTESQAVA
jgi:hypothetical protein